MTVLEGIGFALINLFILGLNIKLYTEILKEKSQRVRVQPGREESDGD